MKEANLKKADVYFRRVGWFIFGGGLLFLLKEAWGFVEIIHNFIK
jgi:hypothetical protein